MPGPEPAHPSVRGSRHPARTVAALALLLALGGCSGDDPAPVVGADQPSGAPKSQETAGALSLSGRWPLTGLPVRDRPSGQPVTVVKIDNAASSEPQVGLAAADLVVEELVEGGTTRLAAFFHSRIPDLVGPVRSMRASDIGIVTPAEAVLVASGGAPPTLRRIDDAGISAVIEDGPGGPDGPGFERDSARTAPYDLMMRLPELVRSLEQADPPPPYLSWGPEKLPAGRPARELAADFGNRTTSWRYDGAGYLPLDGFAPVGDRFRPATVLVLRVRVGDAGYLDPGGFPVPETSFVGSGPMSLFHGGREVRGTWTKQRLDATLELRTAVGELQVPPGRTWIELVPAKTGDLRVSR